MIINGFLIEDKGDPTVGIFSKHWELQGEFEFFNQEEYEGFISNLTDAFEWVTEGRIYIIPLDKVI